MEDILERLDNPLFIGPFMLVATRIVLMKDLSFVGWIVAENCASTGWRGFPTER